VFSIFDENNGIWKHSVPLKKSNKIIYVPKYSHRLNFLVLFFELAFWNLSSPELQWKTWCCYAA